MIVKLLKHHTPSKLETMINEWIEENYIAFDILDLKVNVSNNLYLAVIIYAPKGEKGKDEG